MNALDRFELGHQMVMDAIHALPEDVWEQPGAAGKWSVKDIAAHLASYEHVLLEALEATFCHGPSPTLDRWLRDHETFDEAEVLRRRSMTPADVLAEYEAVYYEIINLLIRVPSDELRQTGLLPWEDRALTIADFITAAGFRHQEAYSTQIETFRSRLAYDPGFSSAIRSLA